MNKLVGQAISVGLYERYGLKTVITDLNGKKPIYPYYSMKFTTAIMQPLDSGYIQREIIDSESDFDKDVLEKMSLNSKMIISFNSYSDKYYDSLTEVQKAWEWFKFTGQPYLKSKGIVVVNVGGIQDRTIMLVDNYEYRQGFDLELRVMQHISRAVETIETHDIKGGII